MTGYSVSLATLFSMRLLIKKDKKILSLPRKRILRRESIDTSKIISRVTELNLRLRYSARASTSEKKISCLPTQKVEFIKSGWRGAKPSEISSKIWNLNRKIWFVVVIGADDEYGKPIWINLISDFWKRFRKYFSKMSGLDLVVKVLAMKMVN